MNLFVEGWYVLYVRSRAEKKVNNLLQQYYLHSYLPLVKKIKQWSDRKKVIYEPLFPSYIFVYIDNSKLFSEALFVDGALGFVKFNRDHARVKDQEIKNIQLLLKGEYDHIELSSALPKAGEMKMIKYGLLSGLECEIIKAKNANKILVRLDSININITATLPMDYLEAI